MTGKSAFDLQEIQQTSYEGGSGLLEHLKLPPVLIRFIRKNKKNLQIGAVAVSMVVVCLVAYNSYRTNRIQKASSALSVAMQAAGPERRKALSQVAADYSGTPSADWAGAEFAHELMKEGKFKEAAERYAEIRKGLSASDPLAVLLTFGLAQANEAAGQFEAAIAEYKALQKITGYEGEGFNGLTRVYEFQGDIKQALAVSEEYLATFTGQDQNSPIKTELEEKIARLKARQ